MVVACMKYILKVFSLYFSFFFFVSACILFVYRMHDCALAPGQKGHFVIATFDEVA